MKARLTARPQAIIDSICGQGCQHVRQFIQHLQQGKLDEKTKSLNAQERKLILTELQSIMSVYKHR